MPSPIASIEIASFEKIKKISEKALCNYSTVTSTLMTMFTDTVFAPRVPAKYEAK